MKKLFLSSVLLGTIAPAFGFEFLTPHSAQQGAGGHEWMLVQVTPAIINSVDSHEWTRIFWCDFKQISRKLVLSAKPYRKHPFVFEVHTRKLLNELARHHVMINRYPIRTMPERVALFIDGKKCIIRADSDLAQLLFSLAQ